MVAGPDVAPPQVTRTESPFPVSRFSGTGCGERTDRAAVPGKQTYSARSPLTRGLRGEDALSCRP